MTEGARPHNETAGMTIHPHVSWGGCGPEDEGFSLYGAGVAGKPLGADTAERALASVMKKTGLTEIEPQHDEYGASFRWTDDPKGGAGTVPVAVESNGKETLYGDFTYVTAPEIRLSNVRDATGDLQRADVTLTVPKDARDHLGTTQLYVVARSSSLLPFVEEGSTRAAGSEPAPIRSLPIDFDDDGEAHLFLNFPSDSEQSLVVAESTPRDMVDARIGTAVDFDAVESGPGVWVYVVAVLGAAAVVIIGIVVVRRRRRRSYGFTTM